MIVEDKLFFADPSTFNDPLDAKPAFEVDLSVDKLTELLKVLFERRLSQEIRGATNIKIPRSGIVAAHIETQIRTKVLNLLADIHYRGSESGLKLEDVLGNRIHAELLRGYERGIVSFSTRANCPLLWSHYGDQHKGICVGYSALHKVPLEPVSYGGDRCVKASLVMQMVNGDQQAKKRVDNAVLLKKAHSWRYEKEWRLIGPPGSQSSILELEEVIFGLRCPLSVMFAVTKALEGRERPVKLYVIRVKPDTFLLQKCAFNIEEMMAGLPFRAMGMFD